jgi:hypothetical protein
VGEEGGRRWFGLVLSWSWGAGVPGGTWGLEFGHDACDDFRVSVIPKGVAGLATEENRNLHRAHFSLTPSDAAFTAPTLSEGE